MAQPKKIADYVADIKAKAIELEQSGKSKAEALAAFLLWLREWLENLED